MIDADHVTDVVQRHHNPLGVFDHAAAGTCPTRKAERADAIHHIAFLMCELGLRQGDGVVVFEVCDCVLVIASLSCLHRLEGALCTLLFGSELSGSAPRVFPFDKRLVCH